MTRSRSKKPIKFTPMPLLLLQICFELKCIVSIENPARSWLWPLLAMLVKETGRTDFIRWYFSLVSTMFDACMHGSTRDKSTTILGSPGVFESLGIRCDKSHSHQAWSATKTIHQGWVFDTAAEAEYPALLSQTYCSMHSATNTTAAVSTFNVTTCV